MPWLQFRIDTSAALAPACEEYLLARGAAAVTLQDNADQPLYDQDRAATPLWTQTCVSGLFPASTDTAAVWLAAPESIMNNALHRVEILEDKDWEREWMQHYSPLQFAPKLWICPSWLSPPDASAVNILLDPGLAFGTGTHATTAMCLRALTELPTPPKRVVDYGCGSGVLAIASLLLGSEWALGVDTDPQALVATRNNADRNGIAAQRLEVSLPFADRPLADLVVANILAGPLCDLADTLCQHLSSGGELLLSGILSEQVPALQAAYRHHIALSVLDEREGWVALYGKRDSSLR
jgi:ribosomal protein L11 methyltransferase